MNCQLCQKEFDAYREDKLSGVVRVQVEAHLESCPDCSVSYQLLILANKVMDAEKETQSNPFLVTRIMSGIEEMESKNRSFQPILTYQRILKPILIGVSLAAAIFSGVVLGSTYLSTESDQRVPVELSYMNDAALESVDLISQL
ncbi:MAG: zf-HC2 domain-containing protein [Prolixibacteraceae bacterium]